VAAYLNVLSWLSEKGQHDRIDWKGDVVFVSLARQDISQSICVQWQLENCEKSGSLRIE